MCLYPRLMDNKKYTKNKKNGGIIPAVRDIRTKTVAIACGKCIECMKRNATDWRIRLTEDIKDHKNPRFITLTFSDESLAKLREEIDEKIKEKTEQKIQFIIDNEIATQGVKQFLNRWRAKHKKSIRHWLVTELGHTGTERIHLHGIIYTDESEEEINERWGYGMTWIGEYVNERTVNYIVKYIHKIDANHKGYKPKVLTTPGIGSGYMKRHNATLNRYNPIEETKETYRFSNGHEAALPIYYRNKIYTERQKEDLWIEKLDKKERWVGGEKICIKNGEESYYKALEYYRKKNKRLGYGDDSKEWNITEYIAERTKRKLMNDMQTDSKELK